MCTHVYMKRWIYTHTAYVYVYTHMGTHMFTSSVHSKVWDWVRALGRTTGARRGWRGRGEAKDRAWEGRVGGKS